MLEREIKVNGVYKHFKGTYHQVIGVAKDAETLEEKVIYNHQDTKELWVRDKNEFLSEVDCQKYPDVKQKYRLLLSHKLTDINLFVSFLMHAKN